MGSTTQIGLYARIFTRTGIPFGLAMGVYFGFVVGVPHGLERGIVIGIAVGVGCGLLFGLLMSAVLGTMAIRATRNAKPGALAVVQERTAEVAGSRAVVVERVCAALSHLPKARPPRVDADGRSVESVVGWTWKSWGEVVSVRLEEGGPGVIRVRIHSRPRLVTTVVDYGKGYENVETIVAALGPYAASPSATA